VLREQGLDLVELAEFKAEHETVVGMPDTKTITNQDLLELDCDILVPAAVGDQIHGGNAGRIKAKLVVEAANRPTTPTADDILKEKGIFVLPDIIANAGGVTVSYYEWVQNHANEQWDFEAVDRRMKSKIFAAVDNMFDHWQAFAIGAEDAVAERPEPNHSAPDFRTIALIIAIERVAKVTLLRGIWP